MSELDQFKETYITECFELLEEMKEKLLSFDAQEPTSEDLNAIFRCAHSIKGGAGAFGFNQLVNFTHILEFLLDAMRQEKVDATEEVIDTLLKSVDVVNKLVTAASEGTELPDDFAQDLSKKLEEMSDGSPSSNNEEIELGEKPKEKPKESKGESFFDISFIPNGKLFASGNEPLLIIRELKRVGKVQPIVDLSKIPTLKEMNIEECYINWKLEVSSEKEIDEIKEVFEFVEGECDLEIQEFGAICTPESSSPEKDLSENDECGGLFDDAVENIAAEKEEKKAVVAEAKEPNTEQPKTAAVSSIRVDLSKVDNLVNMVGELVITQAMITQQTRDLPHDKFHNLIQGVEEFTRHTRELQEAVMAVRMQPVKSVFARMPRIVRDLSKQLGKDVRIEMSGENTEIDKTVIEQLADPLTHMIRNAVDHGIDKPEDRKKRGKPEQGVITLSADNSGGRINIEVSDDGLGIKREVVLEKAINNGVVSKDDNLSDEEIDNLIFAAGFSTASEVTDVSGRGVGMDVVRRNISDLGGTIEIDNRPGEGTSFFVSLPLTLAILDGMIIRIGNENYIIPINNIIESLSPKEDELQNVSSGSDVINVRGEFIPILYLNKIFSVAEIEKAQNNLLVVLVESGRNKFGLVVDELVGQQQVVIKNIEENSDPVEGISGATILGDGNVSLILDIAQLQHMTKNTNSQIQAA